MLPTSWVRWNIVDLKSLLFYYYYNYLWYKSLACTIGKELVSLRGEHHGGGGFTSDRPNWVSLPLRSKQVIIIIHLLYSLQPI